MNKNKVQAEINKIIEAQTYRAIKQYPAAKHQINTLTELGIIELVPKRLSGKLGYQDAQAIIENAQDAGKVGPEGDQFPASALYQLLNETKSETVPGFMSINEYAVKREKITAAAAQKAQAEKASHEKFLHEMAQMEARRKAESNRMKQLTGFTRGDRIKTRPHVRWQSLKHGAVIDPAIRHDIPGGRRGLVHSVFQLDSNTIVVETTLGWFDPDEIEPVS